MKSISFFLLSVLSLVSVIAAASEQQADLKRGKDLSQYCIGCHGEFGIAPVKTNPNLAGQNAQYLEYALTAYRDGKRKGGMAFIMQANAGRLSDKDIRDLAAYFSSLPGRNASSKK